MATQYRLISSDGHLEVPPERWRQRVPKQLRERAPRTIRLDNGGDGLLLEGLPPLEANFLDLRAGRPSGQWQPFGLRIEDAAGTGSPQQRVEEQKLDGIDAEVLFPAMLAGPVIWRKINDDDLYRAVVRAYNGWLAEEYCSVARRQLIGIGVIPETNINDAVEELQYCARQGLRGVVLGNFPSGKDYPTPEDDRFWAAALDAAIAVTVHTKLNPLAGLIGPHPPRLFVYPKEDPAVMQRMRRGFLEWITIFGLPPAVSIAQLVLSGVFERFPALKVFFAETRLGWVPFWLENCDLWYQRHIGWAEEYLGLKPLARRPSDYVREHIYFSVQYERVAVELRHHIGVGQIMFATDFPHIECEWPKSGPIIDEIYADIPEDEKRRIWAENAVEFFKLSESVQ
jgi:predicted TIM-barrel fold metal-dependent hydrolase